MTEIDGPARPMALPSTLPASWQAGLDSQAARWRTWCNMMFVDHGILRPLYSNCVQIVPGVFRSSQPGPVKLRRFARRGLRTVINLRGESHGGSYLYESEACTALGLRLLNWRISSRRLPEPQQLLDFIQMLRTVERPLLMHCKSGADRAGFAAGIWMLAMEAAPPRIAARQLSPRYLHFRQGGAGVLDAFFESYAARTAAEPILFEDWVENEYCPEEICAGFKEGRYAERFATRVLHRE